MGVAVMTEIMAIIVPVYPDIWEHIVKRMLQFAKQVIQFLFEIFVLPLIYLCQQVKLRPRVEFGVV